MDEKIRKYVDTVFEINENLDLTAASKEEFLNYHVVDALMITKLGDFKSGSNVVDIGSGQGIPGIVVAIKLPKVNVTLVESITKKSEFLSYVVNLLKLKNVRVINARVEDFCRNEGRDRFDVVLARGVEKLNVLLEYALPLLKTGGLFLPQKGKALKREMKEAKNALATLGGEIEEMKWYRISDRLLSVPFIRKIKEGPSKYPRRSGIPSKRPIV